jgi:collagenase-like PrtC family protease
MKVKTETPSLRFALPMNWQPDYFIAIPFDHVGEIYGKLREDYPGGGKSSMAQAQPTRQEVADAVKETHSRGMEFNYLLNATCIGNHELTRRGYRNIRKLLDWLSLCKVDCLTVALPFLLEMIKKHYPHFRVAVSTQAAVDTLEHVCYWQDLGADSITLSHVSINRDFRELRRITEHARCQLQLIANMICKRRCPSVTLHGNFNAHASQTFAATNRYNMDYYFVACLARNFSNPLSIIKSNWIRPEDLAVYEELGIHRFKIAERGLTTAALARIAGAYEQRGYSGNFMDLVPTMSKYIFMQKGKYARSMKELFRMPYVNIFRMRDALKRMSELRKSAPYYESLGIVIDNRKLDGVLKTFMEKDCLQRSCEGCGYCERLAADAVEVSGPQARHAGDIGHLRTILDNIVSGRYLGI